METHVSARKVTVGTGEGPRTHLLPLGPAADLQTLTFADGHLEAERDPDVAQVLHPRVEGDALHAANVLPAEGVRGREGERGRYHTVAVLEVCNINASYSRHHSVGMGGGSLGLEGSVASFWTALLKAY